MTQRPCHFIDDESDLGQLIERLRGVRALALDTESNSFHAYFERVCLIQLSTDEEDWAIDPLKIDVRPLGAILSDPQVEVVVHAADYDVRCLKRDFSFRIEGLFDTMLAARLLGRAEVGLAALVRDQFGVVMAKAFQRSDWGRRPLSPEQVAYAHADTRYLLPLARGMREELVKAKLWEQAKAQFARQAGCEPREKRFDREGFRKIRGFRSLAPGGRAIVRALYLLREECARASNRPPFKIYGDDVILRVACESPRSLDELARVKGLSEGVVRRNGKEILAAIEESVPKSQPEPTAVSS